jgi:hypothetical protein
MTRTPADLAAQIVADLLMQDRRGQSASGWYWVGAVWGAIALIVLLADAQTATSSK